MSGLFKYWKKVSKNQEEPDIQSKSGEESENDSDTENTSKSCDLMSLDENESIQNADVISMKSRTFSDSGSNFFDNKSTPCRPFLKVYPPTYFGKDKQKNRRRFNSDWYSRFIWLEYNTEKDAAFCFACRVFLPNPTEKTFTHNGYRDWKNATDKTKGLTKHQQSTSHDCAMKNWEDFLNNQEKAGGNAVASSFAQIDTDQKKWLFAVFTVTRFLSANGLPFRGTNESDIQGDGLFLRSFSQLLFQLDPNWETIHRHLPKNAQYTSPMIQNEVISVLASLVKDKIAQQIRNARIYTIMADGTTDKNRKEIQGLVFRYKVNGVMEEHCLNIKNVEDRSAKGIFQFIKESLEKYRISKDGIVSQSFDGASVMSGGLGGLQKLISDFCGRRVLYVHCFLHKIHLVMSFVMKNLAEIEEYFSIVTTLYNFFKKAAVSEAYGGSALKRLIETRWSGHFDSTKNIYKNYSEIVNALLIASKSRKLKCEDRAVAIGLLSQIGNGEENPIFLFINCLMFNLLQPVDIVVKTLQSPTENAVSAFTIIREVNNDLKEKKNNADFREKLDTNVKERSTFNDNDRRPKRSATIPDHFSDYVIDESLPTNNRRTNAEIIEECLDLLLSEFERRFSTENIALWQAMCALSPTDDKFLDFETMEPLFLYAETIPVLKDFFVKENLSGVDLEAECRIFARVLKNKEWEKDENDRVDLVEVSRFMTQNHGKGAPVLVSLFDLATTAGFTSTRVECVFSSLSRIDSPQRRSMATERECDLAYLSFESQTLMNLSFDDFFKCWKSSPRRL